MRSCLEAIARQTVKPYEVIVVDNNSTDDSAAVARRFPFARVVSETKQGVRFARSAGFDAAHGDIIGRIDADSRLPADWVAKVSEIFEDQSIHAVSGSLRFYDIAASWLVEWVDFSLRGWMARHMNDRIFLVGSNMAIRRQAWQTVRQAVCTEGNFHEDLDLALHLSEHRQRVVYKPELVVYVSARRIDTSLPALCTYMKLSPHTYARHGAAERFYMYPLIAIIFIHYIHLRVLFRGYDADSGHFRWSAVWGDASAARVDPGLASQAGLET